MNLCVVSFKECWQNEFGEWFSYGGFPLQMASIGSLFNEMSLVVVRGRPRDGGIRLPTNARVVAMRRPAGRNTWRKVYVLLTLPYYLTIIARYVLECDVAHVPLPGDIPFLGMFVALFMRKRLIARYGSSWEVTPVTTIMNRVTKMCMRLFAGGRNIMLATGVGNSRPAKDMDWLYVTVISEDEIASVRPDFDRAPGNTLQLAYVGRLSIEKGIEYLVRALSFLRNEIGLSDSTLRLSIIGYGPQREELTRLVELERCTDWVHFTGQLNRSDTIDRLLETDICVLPSLTESFCKARLDAMFCGVPVVTTEVGFGREIIGRDGERGWLASTGNVMSLAQVLYRILIEPHDWSSLRKRCREYAERFTLEGWAQEIGRICARNWNIQFENGKLKT